MDPIIKLLMSKYKMSEDEARRYAPTLLQGPDGAAWRKEAGPAIQEHSAAGFDNQRDYELYLQRIHGGKQNPPAQPFALDVGGHASASPALSPMAQRMALIKATREGRLQEADDILTEGAIRQQNLERERKLFRASGKKTKPLKSSPTVDTSVAINAKPGY